MYDCMFSLYTLYRINNVITYNIYCKWTQSIPYVDINKEIKR